MIAACPLCGDTFDPEQLPDGKYPLHDVDDLTGVLCDGSGWLVEDEDLVAPVEASDG